MADMEFVPWKGHCKHSHPDSPRRHLAPKNWGGAPRAFVIGQIVSEVSLSPNDVCSAWLANLVKHPVLSVSDVLVAFDSRSKFVIDAIVSRFAGTLPAEYAARALLDGGDLSAYKMALRDDIPVEVVREYLLSDSVMLDNVRVAVSLLSRRVDVGREIFNEDMATNGKPALRRAIASSGRAPMSLLALMSTDEYKTVRSDVARNWKRSLCNVTGIAPENEDAINYLLRGRDWKQMVADGISRDEVEVAKLMHPDPLVVKKDA